MNADALKTLFRYAFHLETQLDRLTNSLRDAIEGPRLCVAARKLWDGGNVVSFGLALYDDIELAW